MEAVAPGSVTVRLAEQRDAARIADIYNVEVTGGFATLDTVPVTVEERCAWLLAHDVRRHPVLVAERDGAVIGWGALTAWSPRIGYARTAEVSVYIAAEARRLGVGRRLLAELIARGRAAGLGVLLSRINSASGPSLRLHEELGFSRLCVMRRVGEKLGVICDIELWEYQLDS